MLSPRILVVLVAAWSAFGLVGCKGQGESEQTGSGEYPAPLPIGGEGDATAPQALGSLQAGDNQSLIMDLQRAPAAGSANLFACWDLPDADLAVGRAVCADDQRVVEIKAANVDFVCRTNPEYGTVAAREAFDRSGCSKYTIFSYQFVPSLWLELVAPK